MDTTSVYTRRAKGVRCCQWNPPTFNIATTEPPDKEPTVSVTHYKLPSPREGSMGEYFSSRKQPTPEP